MTSFFKQPAVATPAPILTPPAPMPISDDAAAEDAKRKAKLKLRQRSGRASTILSDSSESDTLG